MSFAVTYSRASLGIQAPLVRVEAHISNGLPKFLLVGLPETAVRESRERVRSAIQSCGFKWPASVVTVNLAPADLPKMGGRFDLPVAIGILAATKQIPAETLSEYEFAGELGLSGELRRFKGALSFAIASQGSKRQLIVPKGSADEAILVDQKCIYAAENLMEVCRHLCGQTLLLPHTKPILTPPIENGIDLSEIKGQLMAIRALGLAASGGHNLLFVGPPGVGKTLLAKRLPSILPQLNNEEMLETFAISQLQTDSIDFTPSNTPPFREPHHGSSPVALIGGGTPPQPGEVSLAHNGVLFLDELPEFNRNVLESLREPLESAKITISRAKYKTTFPAKFQLIAAMNPCPCGYNGDKERTCRCTTHQIQRYQQRISGPLLDRIDLHVHLHRPTLAELLDKKPQSLTSTMARETVKLARNSQLNRQGKLNARLSTQEIDQQLPISTTQQKLIEQFNRRNQISARLFYRLRCLARTIADIEGCIHVEDQHFAEAISYKSFTANTEIIS